MRWTVGTKIAIGFGITVAVFVAVGIVSYRGTAQLIQASEMRQQTYQSLDALNDARLALRGVGLALRTYLISGSEAHLAALKTAESAVEQPLQDFRTRVADDDAKRQRVDKMGAMLKDYFAATDAIAELRRSKGLPEATQVFLADDTRRILGGMAGLLAELQKELDSALVRRTAQSHEEAGLASRTIVVGSTIAVLLALVAGWIITRDIAVPLKALTGVADRVTSGDLRGTVSMGPRSDEIGVLGRTLERMTQSLQGVARTAEQIAAGDLRATVQPQSEADVLGNAIARMSADLRTQFRALVEGVGVLSAAATEIVASSSQLAASATQSAAAVSETTTTVEEVRHTALLASQKAKLVSDSAQRAVLVSESGRKSAQDVETGMARIRSQMEAIAAGMVQLSERNQAVGQIIAAVEDLATQSNMLAVNAAIEAAKAGEHGKGFGVVAQEVKSLAEQSRQATTQVRSILGDIQKATAAAVMATEEGGKVVEAGARQAEVSGGAVESLGSNVNEAAQAALQIAASSQQQQVGMDQVASAMDSIKQASTQNVASAAQLEATARNLNELGQRLKQMVERYQV
jgi:methyl-accepting chemotaxis protein